MVFRWTDVISLLAILIFLAEAGLALRFLAVGDWGTSEPGHYTEEDGFQRDVANAMEKWAEILGPPDFIISTGDNFYPGGVEANDNTRFEYTWRRIYDFGHLRQVPWYVAIGNHDYHQGTELELVKYDRKNNTWNCPYLWYSKTFQTGSTKLHMIVIDSTGLRLGKHNPNRQYKWIKEELVSTDADWVVIVSHQPVYTAGVYGPMDQFMVHYMLPLVEKFGVNLLLSGHDHSLQHIRSIYGVGVDYVISGAGGKYSYEERTDARDTLASSGISVRYYGCLNGFVAVDVHDNKMQVNFYDTSLTLVHNFTRFTGSGYRQLHSLNVL